MTGASKMHSDKPPVPLYTKFPSNFERKCYRLRNSVNNKLYPFGITSYATLTAAAGALIVKKNCGISSILPNLDGKSKLLQLVVLSLAFGYLPVFFSRLFLHKFYFSYKGFLFENPKNPSFFTKFWGLCRTVLSVCPPLLHSTDQLLPYANVPDLKCSVENYLASMKHILEKEEFDELENLANEFLATEGPKLHRYAKLYRLFTSNYITGFWEKYAYLSGRDGLLINSSIAYCDRFDVKPIERAQRAAQVVYGGMMIHLAGDRQAFMPPGGGLLTSSHYDQVYSTTRIPGEECDILKKYGISSHVAVICNGAIYRLDICDGKRNIYTIEQLTETFRELLNRNDVQVEGAAARVTALTTDRRDKWAINRRLFFLENPSNKRVLEMVESAAFMLILDEKEDYGITERVFEREEILSKYTRNMLLGDGANRWADKSFNFCVTENGMQGGTLEHTVADGAEFNHTMEFFNYLETRIFTQSDLCPRAKANEKCALAERYEVEVNEEMKSEIERCYASYVEQKDDVDFTSLVREGYGKGRIKECGLSPDAFIQMAIQLTNYKDQGKFVNTYEPASPRFFQRARTETLRPVSDDSCAFVKGMSEETQTIERRRNLLRKACQTHVRNSRECMVGKGFDRHFFVLLVLSRGLGIESRFLQTYIQQKWKLSTSQVPDVTKSIDEDKEPSNSWLGGGFCPVAKDGYGICYRFAGNHSFVCHISSFHSAQNTNSERFKKTLLETMDEMFNLFHSS